MGAFTGLTAEQFGERFKALYAEEPDEGSAGQFAAGTMLVAAIEAAGSVEAGAVAAQLRTMQLKDVYGEVSFRPEDGVNAMQVRVRLSPRRPRRENALELRRPLRRRA